MDDNIEKAKNEFEMSFSEPEFYDRQTQDAEHLNNILNALTLRDGDKVLDLGTGSGYLAFAIARVYPRATVVGLDIVSKTLEHNRILSLEQGISNLEFINYGGVSFPFDDGAFDWVVTRYALHHFPEIYHTFDEIVRVLKPKGFLFLADPTPNHIDARRFVDNYMRLRDDGHNRFYTLAEFSEFSKNSRMELKSSFTSEIRFARKMDATYVDLLQKTNDTMKQAYKLEIIGDECYITEDVLNMVFQKY